MTRRFARLAAMALLVMAAMPATAQYPGSQTPMGGQDQSRQAGPMTGPGMGPGGMEHVRAPGRRLARLQDLVTPLWRRVFGGCHPNRDTLRVLEGASFEVRTITRRLQGIVVEGCAAVPAEQRPGATGSAP